VDVDVNGGKGFGPHSWHRTGRTTGGMSSMPPEQADALPRHFGVVTKIAEAELVVVAIAYRWPLMRVSAV
jgi:hypothetical protein